MSDPIGEARRRQRRRERLGCNASCVICGENDLRALIPASVHLVEQDHLYGRQRDPEAMIAFCRNHHAIVTEERRDAAVPMKPGPNPLEELALMHRSRGLALKRIGEADLKQAEWLLDLNDHLIDGLEGAQEVLEDFPSTYQLQEENND